MVVPDGGRLLQVVASQRWSPGQVRLYLFSLYLSCILTLNKTVMYVCVYVCVCVFLYNLRNCWPIFLLNCLNQREWHGQNNFFPKSQNWPLIGKNINFAMRRPQKNNQKHSIATGFIAMRGPQRSYQIHSIAPGFILCHILRHIHKNELTMRKNHCQIRAFFYAIFYTT